MGDSRLYLDGDIETRILVSQADIEAVAAEWRALEAHCADPLSYFQSYDWCVKWVRQFADEACRPFVITLWRGSILLAVWPRMVVEAAGISRLETLGGAHSQYCGLLLRRGARNALIERHLDSATRRSGCDVSVSRAVLEGTSLGQLLGESASVTGSDNAASILDLSHFRSSEDYTAQLGKLQKRNRNRRRNHLERLGTLRFDVVWPDSVEFGELVQQCTAMKRRWLQETGRFSVGFSMDGYEAFLAALEGDEAELSGACVSVLRAGERVVAIELGFIRERHYYAYIGGFDWELRDWSPGKVQMDMTVCWLIDQGITGYDLLINPADYKASWTSRTIAVMTKAQPLTWKGRIYTQAWLPSLRPALKRLHGRLPVLVDRLVGILRPAACMLLYV
jgi:CelD/BcsL family acetyltransferase involved in cellulose biosynthesis